MANILAENITLEPMDLHDAVQFTELQRQRILCGWDHSTSVLESWRIANSAKAQAMFWVIPHSLAEAPSPQRYAGHIAMSKKTYDDHNGVNNILPDMTVMSLENLFILPE